MGTRGSILLRIGAGLVVFLLLLGTLIFCLSMSRFQQWVMDYSLQLLSEKLQTRVVADSVSVSPTGGRVALYGFMMEDRRQQPMLQVDTLEARLDLWALYRRHIVVRGVKLSGATAHLYRERRDSAANFQFVIEAFRHKGKKAHPAAGPKFDLDVQRLDLEDIHCQWDSTRFQLARLSYHRKALTVRGLSAQTDNGRPRRNFHNPHLGAFDPGHIDATLDLDARIQSLKPGDIRLQLTHLHAHDSVAGLHLRDLTARCRIQGKSVEVQDLHLHFGSATVIDIPRLQWRDRQILPADCRIAVTLQDIAKPFAPALCNFTTPLRVQTTVSGTPERIAFDGVRVSTTDQRLVITTHGALHNVADKPTFRVVFDDIRMQARRGIKEQIINHFASKINIKMKQQIRALGDIRFAGNLRVLVADKKVRIAGQLGTPFGRLRPDFTIDSRTKYMTGTLSTPSFELGRLFHVEGLGALNMEATYRFDIASERAARQLHRRHGNLPMGTVQATIHDARYRKIHFTRITAQVQSDGTTACGLIYIPQKLLDISTAFEFTQTDHDHHLKIRPGLRRHRQEDITLQQYQQKQNARQARREKRRARMARFKAKFNETTDK